MPDTEVRNNEAASCYEAVVDGQVAGFVTYLREPGRLVLLHAEVDAAAEGKGVGSALARQSLADVRRQGLLVVPRCPFIAGYIDRHPDYADLVAE